MWYSSICNQNSDCHLSYYYRANGVDYEEQNILNFTCNRDSANLFTVECSKYLQSLHNKAFRMPHTIDKRRTLSIRFSVTETYIRRKEINPIQNEVKAKRVVLKFRNSIEINENKIFK